MLNKKGVNMGKIRFNITKDGLSFSKGKLSVPIDRGVKYCPTCKNRHPITKDGYEYLDCMLYIKERDGKGKTSVEIWDNLNRTLENHFCSNVLKKSFPHPCKSI